MPWHLLTLEQQMQYVNAFHALRNNGILDIFIEAHHLTDTPESFANVHYTAEFFPWHSYFLTEIESQIRNLGEDYKCFSLPYWDFTVDAGYATANDMPVYNSVLGSDGNEDDDYCVEDELWNRWVYPTTFLCSATEIELGIPCCLKRHNGPRGHIPSADDMVPHIYSYRRWQGFQEAVVKEHTYVHGYCSGQNNKTHMYGHNAAEDPLFIMLHNFLMYLRGLRTTCYGYDRVINELEDYVPFAYDPYLADHSADVKPFLDRAMDFNVLATMEWADASKEDITVRKVWDFAHFGISFELGTFWHNNPSLAEYCGDINDTWFYDVLEYGDGETVDDEIGGFYKFVRAEQWRFESVYYGYIVLSVVVMAVLCYFGSNKIGKLKKLWMGSSYALLSGNDDDSDQSRIQMEDYGTF
jgi:hypothetical protein